MSFINFATGSFKLPTIFCKHVISASQFAIGSKQILLKLQQKPIGFSLCSFEQRSRDGLNSDLHHPVYLPRSQFLKVQNDNHSVTSIGVSLFLIVFRRLISFFQTAVALTISHFLAKRNTLFNGKMKLSENITLMGTFT